jgi:RNA polymerase sigma factor (sigma-70 family)
VGSALEILVRLAKEGDKKSLEDLVYQIQNRIYALAVRMLYSPYEAEDAAQEILIKIITHLSDFREACSFTTWMFRIATNHLLNCRRSSWERKGISFEQWESEIVEGGAGYWQEMLSEAQQAIIVEEIRISCLQGLLLCLDRGQRIAYILNEVFEVTSQQGAQVLGISPEAYRKRSSRGRMKIRNFMLNNCSLINEENPCHCMIEAGHEISTGELDPDNMLFTNHPCYIKNEKSTLKRLKEFSELERIAVLFKNNPHLSSPDFTRQITAVVSSGSYEIIDM